MITSKPILLKFERSYFKFIKYDIYCDTHSKLRDRGLFVFHYSVEHNTIEGILRVQSSMNTPTTSTHNSSFYMYNNNDFNDSHTEG